MPPLCPPARWLSLSIPARRLRTAEPYLMDRARRCLGLPLPWGAGRGALYNCRRATEEDDKPWADVHTAEGPDPTNEDDAWRWMGINENDSLDCVTSMLTLNPEGGRGWGEIWERVGEWGGRGLGEGGGGREWVCGRQTGDEMMGKLVSLVKNPGKHCFM